MFNTRRVCRFDSISECAAEGARLLSSLASAATSERGSFSVALPGGKSPVALFRELASGPAANEFPWGRTRFFFGDERCVPPSHEHSNYALALANLFEAAPAAPRAVHRIETELPAEQAASRYESLLVRELGDPPALDAVLLGMGADGHTASLFPGDAALFAGGFVAAVMRAGASPDVLRVTLTLRAINASRAAIFVVSGPGKEKALDRVLNDPSARRDLPAAMVSPQGPVHWLVCS